MVQIPGIARRRRIETGPFRGDCLAENNRPGLAQRGNNGGIAMGSVVSAEGRTALRWPARDINNVFDANGDAMERAEKITVVLQLVEPLGFAAGTLGIDAHPGLNLWFKLFDALQAVRHEIAGAQQSFAHFMGGFGDAWNFGQHGP